MIGKVDKDGSEYSGGDVGRLRQHPRGETMGGGKRWGVMRAKEYK